MQELNLSVNFFQLKRLIFKLSQSMNALRDANSNIITRRIHATIRGSLAQFANSGSESASWTSQNGRMTDILGITDLLQGTADEVMPVHVQ